MQNFTFHNPTEIIFGKGTIAALAERVPTDVPVLLVYGTGSIKKNGVYDQVKRALGTRQVIEFSGIEANPRYETCLEALKVVRAERVGFLLSVGGGSVLDGTKLVAAAARFEGADPWTILSHHAKVEAALPIGCVLTLPATGSESNGNSVISRAATQEKLAFSSPRVYPVFSILDPETTYSLPKQQVRNGIVDAFVHVMEQYLTYPADAPLTDRLAEAILSTLVEVGPITLQRPTEYQPRATLVWSATVALNGIIGSGVPQDWATHEIGHELTAFYGVDHAESLAVVMPGLWTIDQERKRAKLEQYGTRVLGVTGADAAIAGTEQFFLSLGMPVRLRDHGIDAEDAVARIVKRFTERGTRLGEHGDLTPEHVARILRARA
jgi:NADP-dependent alcohol dehydrogenase